MRDSGHPRGTVLVVDDEESVGRFARRHFAHISGAIVNAAHVAGAELVSKDDPAASLDLLRRRLDLAHQVGTWQPLPYLTWLREHRGLTPREAEVASLVLQGTTRYADLANHLGISRNTVKRHVASLLDRAGVDSLLDFILRARNIRP